MKLLTTIAAVLISISAFSQDLIEYDNGYFSQNGELLLMEQIDDLTVLHKAGRGNFRKANRFDLIHKNPNLRGRNNTLNFLGGAAGTYVGGSSVFIGLLFTAFDNPVIGVPALAGGTGLCIVSFRAFSRITLSKKGCLRKRDKQFNKVAGKLNEAIQSSNQ